MAFEMEIFAHLRELTDLVFFLIFAYALRLSCASIKALLKALILLRLWRKA